MDSSYVIVTDSNCEMPEVWLKDLDIHMINMMYTLDGQEYEYDLYHPVDMKHYYARMLEGAVPTTVQRNPEDFKILWSPFLEAGEDILHICFSSKLSGTYFSACMAQKELQEEFPQRKIIVVDSLAISVPLAMLVRECAKLRDQGESMECVAKWLEENRQCASALFSVGSLEYLKRGGRISSTAAFFGTLLDVKPLLYLDEEGGLTPFEKVKGRKKALKRMNDLVAKQADFERNPETTVLHCDCEEEAFSVWEQLVELSGGRAKLASLQLVGPVIGAHVGPGLIAVCFWSKDRRINLD